MADKIEVYKKMYDELENTIMLDSELKDKEVLGLMLYILTESSTSVDILTNGTKRDAILKWYKKKFNV